MNSNCMFSDGNVLPEHYMSTTPTNGSVVAGKRKSGRRSWFTPNKHIRLEIAIDPSEQKPVQHVGEDEVEILTLTHFTKPPKVKISPCHSPPNLKYGFKLNRTVPSEYPYIAS